MEKQNRTATNQINFRVTDEEMAVLRVNAERAGFTKIPMYCKRLALGVKVKPQVIDKETGKAILPHVAHIGSNINQLAKKANEGGTVAAAELAAVQAEFEKLWAYILEGKKPQKPQQAAQTEMKEEKQEEQKTPKCQLCGAELQEGQRKDGGLIWYCPNWKDQEKGTHTVLERK